ncbi:MAG: OmpA family protein [Campylobacterales bacterium]|nr:OmpA family protein [Campylobacterales bacterium]
MKSVLFISLSVSALLMTGCVTKKTHELVLEELNQTRSSLSSAQHTIEEQRQLMNEQLGKIKSNQQEIARGDNELEVLKQKKMALQKEFDLLQNNLMVAQSGLKSSQSQLEVLKQIKDETEKRNKIYAHFIAQLQKMIDGGQLTVSIEKGRMVINLPENVLYATGSATINQKGQEALKEIAKLLSEFSERRFQIEGHTDNVPIQSSRYPSNWELSTARALSVVHLMRKNGVASQNISAAGFGEFQPRADNATKEGRTLNRRIEIIMLPNLDILSNELPKVIQ